MKVAVAADLCGIRVTGYEDTIGVGDVGLRHARRETCCGEAVTKNRNRPRAQSREIIPCERRRTQGSGAGHGGLLHPDCERHADAGDGYERDVRFARFSKTPDTSSQGMTSRRTIPIGSYRDCVSVSPTRGRTSSSAPAGPASAQGMAPSRRSPRLFEKRLDGFGELFRMISFEEIGAAAMLSRATAGTVGRKAIFALPGSEKAVRLAMTRLVIPELGHVVQQLSK